MKHARTLLLCLPVLLGFVAPAFGEGIHEDDPHRAAVTRALLAAEGDQGWSTDDIRKRLYAMGDNALPGILDALEQVAAGSRTATLIGDFLGTHDPKKLDAALHAWLGPDPGLQERLRTLHLLARLDDVRVLPLAVEIVAGLDHAVLADPRIEKTWEATVKALVGPDVRDREVESALTGLPVALAASTAKVLVEVGSEEAVEAVVDLLRKLPQDPAPMLYVLRRATRLQLRAAGVAQLVGVHLGHADAHARAAAAALAARAGLATEVPTLVKMLDDKDPRVLGASHTALRDLTATDCGRTSQAWTRWLREEEEWRAQADLSKRLGAERSADLSAALRDIVRHRYACRDLIRLVGGLTENAEPSIRALACAALGALGRVAALPWLRDRLQDDDPAVGRAAAQALSLVADEPLGADPVAWRERLASR